MYSFFYLLLVLLWFDVHPDFAFGFPGEKGIRIILKMDGALTSIDAFSKAHMGFCVTNAEKV